tara:strand:- start:2517 stop:2813 length:297 start_codon:yes stop_codon:yes gene_type:complete
MYLVVQTIINNKNRNIMNNSATVLALASIKCQLSDWSVTTEEDGYTQAYINGRVDGLTSAIKTLQALIELDYNSYEYHFDSESDEVESGWIYGADNLS